MKVNTNHWNKIRYTFFTPVYDLIARHFDSSRKQSISDLNIEKGDKVLIIGAGTGLDLEHIPNDCDVIATDITPSMVEKIKQRANKLNLDVNAQVMDGQNLNFDNGQFDKVILHLILAVIPNPESCIKEAERVLKTGGEIAILDKFVPKNRKVSNLRRSMNVLTNFFFTDITRSFETIVSSTQLRLISDNDANFGGNFRLIRLTKP